MAMLKLRFKLTIPMMLLECVRMSNLMCISQKSYKTTNIPPLIRTFRLSPPCTLLLILLEHIRIYIQKAHPGSISKVNVF